ncbi:hypothetical protein BC832DRAFT_596490 [Gaertneriomyces semiglobifer]|nr:hypothetical protein BC832DRAFT_596490 [Gaertneriomyces semiglobifer]
MDGTVDLKLVSERLAGPPFRRHYSVIQLHDELPVFQLMQLLSDAMAAIDEGNPQSPHKDVDLRNEDPNDTIGRMLDFFQLLKWKEARDADSLGQKLANGDRPTILSALHFLLKDMESHQKRAYLAPFLAGIDIPPEFSHDEGTTELARQVEELQQQFKEVHKTVSAMRSTGNNTAILKREIQQMEDEKQQVLAKISKIKKRVEEIPQHEQWLEAARELRREQQNESSIAERIKDQRSQSQQAEINYNNALQALRDAKLATASAGPDVLFSKMEEDNRMNKYLATENLPKQIEEVRQQIRQRRRVITEPAISESDLRDLEAEIKQLNEEVARIAERKLTKTSGVDDKLALFRQQASIIARKKEGATQRLNILTDEISKLAVEVEKKQQAGAKLGAKMPKGEEFKSFVAELREKSTVYKQKKAELSALVAESGILQRTEEILSQKRRELSSSLSALETKHGISGFHVTHDTLEKVSEKKAELDEAKGRTLEEVSTIIQKLTTSINDRKTHLSPIIQELRDMRQKVQDAETEYKEKKRLYDATVAGIESEVMQLEHDVRAYRQDVDNDQSRFHYLNVQIEMTDVAQQRVMQEMKAYIGGDEALEQQQKSRGFKTYRDLYNKRLLEQENTGKSLREQQKEVKAKHEPNVKQLKLFQDVRNLLALKSAYNAKMLSGEMQPDTKPLNATLNRLVL